MKKVLTCKVEPTTEGWFLLPLTRTYCKLKPYVSLSYVYYLHDGEALSGVREIKKTVYNVRTGMWYMLNVKLNRICPSIVFVWLDFKIARRPQHLPHFRVSKIRRASN
jgi:hypothetical protein